MACFKLEMPPPLLTLSSAMESLLRCAVELLPRNVLLQVLPERVRCSRPPQPTVRHTNANSGTSSGDLPGCAACSFLAPSCANRHSHFSSERPRSQAFS